MSFSNSAGALEWSSESVLTVFPSLRSCLDRDHVAMVRTGRAAQAFFAVALARCVQPILGFFCLNA